VASAADLERHLRRLGEDELLGGPPGRLVAAAQALVAVDALDEGLVDAILLDYAGAAALRAGEWAARVGYRWPPAPPRRLAPAPGRAEVMIEPREPDPGLRHLRSLVLAAPPEDDQEAFETAVVALVLARAVAPGGKAVEELGTASAAMHGFVPDPVRHPDAVPEPWRSLRRAREADGPAGRIAIGAVTPEFDGFAVAVRTLASGPEGWRLEVDVAGEADVTRARRRALAWWAADDRGGRYRGRLERGEVRFGVPLDPRATRLELTVFGATRQAVVRFPLEWA
jgi:hypothetical protein